MGLRSIYQNVVATFRARASPSPPPMVHAGLDLDVALRNVRLAREYVQGITLLVDTARRFQTPLPDPAFKNLHYLRRLLDQAEHALVVKLEPSHAYATIDTPSRGVCDAEAAPLGRSCRSHRES